MRATEVTSAVGRRSRRAWLIVGIVASTVFVASTIAASAEDPPQWELDLFSEINDLPDWLYPVIWPFMQYGVFVTIPIAAVIAWLFKRRRLSVLLAVSGLGVYFGAKVVKEIAGRERPGAFFEMINDREGFDPSSIGFTSGHAAVAAAIATLTIANLGRRWKIASAVLVLIVCFGRIYVGAHLLLDLVGGVALGVGVGSFATYIFGTDPGKPTEEVQE